MFLTKSLYEATPYLLIGVAAYLLLSVPFHLQTLQAGQFYLLIGAALLFFHSGALIWIYRSQSRGSDSRHYPCSHYHDHWKPLDQAIDGGPVRGYVPAPVYEYLPFGYVLLAYACLVIANMQGMATAGLLWQGSAVLLLVAGLSIWLMRGFYRGYHASHHQQAVVRLLP